MTTIAVLGGGKIGKALLGGLVAAGRDPGDLVVVEKDEARRAELAERLGIATGELSTVAADADVLVVAVKPPDVTSVLREATGTGRAPLVISLAAGIPTSALEAALPAGTPVVRVMPNTPMLVGRAMCVLSPGTAAGEDELATAETLLGAVGRTVRVPETQQDLATALSGSGPAYAFLLAEAMIDAGVALGLPRPTATALVAATVEGAGGLLTAPDAHPTLLREAVTSPGGTTAAALGVLEAQGLRAAVAEAVAAARDRSVALGAQYG